MKNVCSFGDLVRGITLLCFSVSFFPSKFFLQSGGRCNVTSNSILFHRNRKIFFLASVLLNALFRIIGTEFFFQWVPGKQFDNPILNRKIKHIKVWDKMVQRVNFWYKNFPTRQISISILCNASDFATDFPTRQFLNWVFYNTSDVGVNSLKRVKIWKVSSFQKFTFLLQFSCFFGKHYCEIKIIQWVKNWS